MTTHHLLLKTSWDFRVVFLMTSPNRSSLNHESKNSWGGVESLFPPRHSWWMVSLRATKKITSKKRKHVHTYRFRPYIPPSSRFFKRWLEISYWWLFWVPLRELNGLGWDMDFKRFPVSKNRTIHIPSVESQVVSPRRVVSAESHEHECMTCLEICSFPAFQNRLQFRWGLRYLPAPTTDTFCTNVSRIWWETQLNGIPEEICFKNLATGHLFLLKNRSEWMAISFEKNHWILIFGSFQMHVTLQFE